MRYLRIRETGRTPVQRNTFYEPLKVWEPQTATGAGETHAQKSAVLEKNLATAQGLFFCGCERLEFML